MAASGPPPSSTAAPGSIVALVHDQWIEIEMIGGRSWQLPIGVEHLLSGPLEHADRPRPEQLTNALGAVTDHFEDVIIESPMVAAAPSVRFIGPHAAMVARVEIGADEVPACYEINRADADDVFRTLVAEPRAERIHNPGLDPAHVDSILATCCAMLAIMRRLELTSAGVTN